MRHEGVPGAGSSRLRTHDVGEAGRRVVGGRVLYVKCLGGALHSVAEGEVDGVGCQDEGRNQILVVGGRIALTAELEIGERAPHAGLADHGHVAGIGRRGTIGGPAVETCAEILGGRQRGDTAAREIGRIGGSRIGRKGAGIVGIAVVPMIKDIVSRGDGGEGARLAHSVATAALHMALGGVGSHSRDHHIGRLGKDSAEHDGHISQFGPYHTIGRGPSAIGIAAIGGHRHGIAIAHATAHNPQVVGVRNRHQL